MRRFVLVSAVDALAPDCLVRLHLLGIISIVSLGGWVFPFGLGGMYWFEGPIKTITEEEVRNGRIEGWRGHD